MDPRECVRRLWYLLNRSRFERDLEKEMATHREMMGSPRQFGNMLLLRERSRDAWGWNWLDALGRDLRYAARGLRREPTFALTAILTLAFGVATTTTAFSIVDAELWRPLPYPHPEQLVAVYSNSAIAAPADMLSGDDLVEWRAGSPAFSDLAAVGRTSRQILQLQTAESVAVTEVTANYFRMLGREALAGTIPSAADASAARAVVLTDRAWQRLFGSGLGIIGQAVTLGGEAAVVAGVIRAGNSLGAEADVFLPLNENALSFRDRSRPMFFNAIGRLQRDATPVVARAQIQAIETRLVEAGRSRRAVQSLQVEELHRYYSANNWRALYFFLSAAAVVLLLSVVNVATLLLGRAVKRTREFAIRGALGGGRGALGRHLVIEGGLLAVCGAGFGLVLTAWLADFFAAQLPSDFLGRGSDIPVDYRVAGFTFALAALVTIIFALAPLMVARRANLANSLGAGSRTGPARTEGRMRGALLIAQIALTLVLLTGAALFVKSFAGLTGIPLGFEPAGVVAVRAALSGPKYSTDAAVRGYSERLLDNARSIPGARMVAAASSSPLGSGPIVNYSTSGLPAVNAAEQRRALIRAVSPEYFQTLGIRVLKGRAFAANDVAGAPRVAIVNEALVREAFAGGDAVGKTIELAEARAPWTNKPGQLFIVGVAANAKEVGLNEVEFADIYVPLAQMPAPSVELIARADVPLGPLGMALRENAARLDPAIPVTLPVTFEERVSRALQGDRVNLLLIASFAAVALLLAAVGIYGTVAGDVQVRTREFGVRMALGAQSRRLVAAALWHAVRIGLAGGAVGLAGVLAAAAVLGDALYLVRGVHNGVLYGVSTTDPAMLCAAFIGIVAVAALAAAIPARRVAQVDPVSALRND